MIQGEEKILSFRLYDMKNAQEGGWYVGKVQYKRKVVKNEEKVDDRYVRK